MPASPELFIDIPDAGGGVRRVRAVLKNSARARNFCVRIVGDGEVSLTKPVYASRREALEFLGTCKGWIAARISSAPKKISLRGRLEARPEIYVYGAKMNVVLAPSRTDAFFVEDIARGVIVFSSPDDASLAAAFKKYAAQRIKEFAQRVSLESGLGVRSVSVRGQRGRWGSMSSNGTMSLNWRLVFLRPELQDYVIRHEFAHTKFMDHSVSFWIFLSRICPNAKRLDRELSKIGAEIIAVE